MNHECVGCLMAMGRFSDDGVARSSSSLCSNSQFAHTNLSTNMPKQPHRLVYMEYTHLCINNLIFVSRCVSETETDPFSLKANRFNNFSSSVFGGKCQI